MPVKKLASVLLRRRGSAGAPASGGGSPPPAYTGPLDLVPGAVVAYGVRALSAAMLGQNIFRLRRDSDDAEMNFAADAVTGDAPVADITTWLAGANGFVVTWYDQSGNGKDATQATAAKQPAWAASQFGAIPSLVFDNTLKQFLGTASITLPDGAWTVFLVANPQTQAGNATGINYENFDPPGEVFVVACGGDGSGGAVVVLDASSDGETDTEAGGTTITITGLLNANHVFDVAWTVGTFSVKVDGVSWTQNNNYDDGAVGSISGPLCLGESDVAAQFTSSSWKGPYAELLIYNGVKSDPNRLSVRENEATYYGITL